MLKIKLQRIGRKHQPSYRLVVAEARSKLGGPSVEDLGFYNPFTKEAGLKRERIEYWIKTGARPTPTAHNLLVKNGVINGQKIKISIKRKESKENDAVAAGVSAPVAAADNNSTDENSESGKQIVEETMGGASSAG